MNDPSMLSLSQFAGPEQLKGLLRRQLVHKLCHKANTHSELHKVTNNVDIEQFPPQLFDTVLREVSCVRCLA